MLDILTGENLKDLAKRALKSTRRRQHLNVHRSYDEKCQILFNVIEPDSYIRPHRHLVDSKLETLIAFYGEFYFVNFDEVGKIKKKIYLSSRYRNCSGTGIGLRIYPNEWHTVYSISSGATLLEVKAGPFDPNIAKEYASWAPEENGKLSKLYLKELKERVV